MKLAFNHHFFNHLNTSAINENGKASFVFTLVEKLLQYSIVQAPIYVVENLIAFILWLPLPIYSSVMYHLISNARGLPHFSGMYLRSLYYRYKLGEMESNVLIDQDVFFAYPKQVFLKEFAYIDKGVKIMSKNALVGRRVHIAPRVFISGGGEFEIEDYACIATNSNIITSTEVLKDGARCSGPMVSVEQRNVLRGKVLIKKDAFVGANVTILPNVIIGVGSVCAAGITVSKSTDDWGIYLGAKTQKLAEREQVKHKDN
jgi:acetyltransferase-like isoleucine patch superfamily enzyme